MMKKIFYGAIIIVCVLLAGLAMISSGEFPKNYRLLAVESGSMTPTLPVGSVVIVKRVTDYMLGDIITFPKGYTTVTHRIVAYDLNGRIATYTTKGDANNTADMDKVNEAMVIGKVTGYIPLMGYVTSFVKTQTGFLLLIVIPSTIIIWTELMNIKEQSKKLIRERKKRKLNPLEKIEVAIGEEEMKIENKINGE